MKQPVCQIYRELIANVQRPGGAGVELPRQRARLERQVPGRVYAGASHDGNQVLLYDCHGGANQQWTYYP